MNGEKNGAEKNQPTGGTPEPEKGSSPFEMMAHFFALLVIDRIFRDIIGKIRDPLEIVTYHDKMHRAIHGRSVLLHPVHH